MPVRYLICACMCVKERRRKLKEAQDVEEAGVRSRVAKCSCMLFVWGDTGCPPIGHLFRDLPYHQFSLCSVWVFCMATFWDFPWHWVRQDFSFWRIFATQGNLARKKSSLKTKTCDGEKFLCFKRQFLKQTESKKVFCNHRRKFLPALVAVCFAGFFVVVPLWSFVDHVT